MSELNYINETVVPRMPKSVSDEQLFVFVPTGSDIIAGIFKINTDDFDINSLPILKIVESESLVSTIIDSSGKSISNPEYNADGYVRAGIIKAYVDAADKALQDAIDLKQDKTDNSLNTTSNDIVGAINEVKGTADSALSKASANETDINDNIKPTLNNAVTTAAEAKDAATRAENNVTELSKKVTNINNQVDANTGNITQLRTDVDGLTTRVDTAEEDIGNLTTKDGELTTRVTNLEQSAYGGETPIGSYDSGPTLPSQDELTNFVITHTTPSREPKLGDVVIFTQIVTGGTDKSYKFMYTASEPEHWVNYVIPTVESATNTDKGILQGTLGDTTGNVQVSIVDGKVADILVKDGSTYKSIKTLLDTLRAALVKTFNNVQFTLVATDDNTITNFPCKYTAYIEGVNVGNVADVYFSATQIPLEIFSSYAEVSANKVSIFATTATNYPESVTVPTVKIS